MSNSSFSTERDLDYLLWNIVAIWHICEAYQDINVIVYEIDVSSTSCNRPQVLDQTSLERFIANIIILFPAAEIRNGSHASLWGLPTMGATEGGVTWIVGICWSWIFEKLGFFEKDQNETILIIFLKNSKVVEKCINFSKIRRLQRQNFWIVLIFFCPKVGIFFFKKSPPP